MMTDPPIRHYVLGTAGHVDHGKSALVLALTGTDPDRLPEEKTRGITIDLGFAEMKIQSPPMEIGIVDVPGHEDFIRNMVAGVSSLDAALLVVAADDGWMPQTEEHLQILYYLGVQHAVIALTKADLSIDERLEVARVRTKVEDTAFAMAPIIPTSVVTGQGINELRSAIVEMLGRLKSSRDIAKPRLPVDRAFTLKGVGTVVTGTLIGGTIGRGQDIVIQPSGTTGRVRSLQNHGRELAVAVPGSRVAINIPDVPVADGPSRGVRRGDVIAYPSACRASTRLSVGLIEPVRKASARDIKSGSLVHLHHATATVAARIRYFKLGSRDVAFLSLQSPLMTFAGDRFILRDGSQQNTIGGGIVLDPLGFSSARKSDSYFASLMNAACHPNDPSAHIQLQLARVPVLRSQSALTQSNFDEAQTAEGVQGVVASRIGIICGPLLIQTAIWETLRKHSISLILNYHQQHPELAGAPITAFRSSITAVLGRKVATGILQALEQALLEELASAGIVVINGIVRQIKHAPSLPPRLRDAGESIRKVLAERPFDPPSRKELCPTDPKQQAMRFLIANGSAIELNADLAMGSEAYLRAIALIRAHLAANHAATVSQLKAVLSSSRRIMVPLIERLDREGITARDGDLRRLRQV
jgi:selenocysteine-specific elongation factor